MVRALGVVYKYKKASRKTAATMSEAEFWKITEPFGWGKKTKDFKAIKKALMKKLSPDQAEALQNRYTELTSTVYDKLLPIIQESEVWIGDDSLDDLVAHIVGMGKKEYNAVTKNPLLGLKRAEERDYEESFSYALPSEEDYKSLDIRKYVKWANEIIDRYTKVLDASEDDIPWKNKLERPLKQVVKIMEGFLKKKDPHALLKEEKEAKKASEEVDKILRRFHSGMWMPEEGTIEEAIKDAGNKWFVWNFFTDVRDYLMD